MLEAIKKGFGTTIGVALGLTACGIVAKLIKDKDPAKDENGNENTEEETEES